MVDIKEYLEPNRDQFRPLLLLGDEDEQQVASYYHTGRLLVAYSGVQCVGVLLLTEVDRTTTEVKNLAVATAFQRHGIGTQLITAAKKLSNSGQRLIVGTGDADVQNILFYLKNGFRFYGVRRGFFNRYAEPIIANGVQLRDMVMLEQTI